MLYIFLLLENMFIKLLFMILVSFFKKKMENKEDSVEIVTNKIYFIEDAMNISFKFINKVRVNI